MASTKAGLFNFIVIGLLLAVVAATYVYHATPIIEEAEKVNKENAVAQFQRVVMLARAQWIKTKQSKVLIYEIDFDASGGIRQKQQKAVAAELFVNAKGWPEGLEANQGNACEYLFTLATLREFDMSSNVSVSDKYVNGYLQCAFSIQNKVWFDYNAGSGVVRERKS
ncbi:hypothetical protein RJ41_04125 [Alteromonas marina]|uniref:Uncharacterized protein n=1 Tax=Alteromonas marina TaxID=203795 RepID=A0A0B3YFC0_9ALTE|nr:hypothetical protein [Alteromonas marina]KHT55802.1 hypothetical protein RJ41_04125 [Alteromonas marina]